MSKTKRAFSAFLAAAMLVSLAAPAVFAAKSASSTGSDQTDHLVCTVAANADVDTCSQVADGISTVTLTTEADADSTAEQLFIDLAGLTIVSTTGSGWSVVGGNISVPSDEAAVGNTVTLRAPAAAGSSSVKVYTIDPTTGLATLEGNLTITWTASSGLGVSEANSVVKVAGDNLCDGNADADNTGATKTTVTNATAVTNAAATGGNVDLCVVVYNANGSAINNATVAVTMTPVGLVNSGQTASGTTNSDGFVAFNLTGSGLAGTATISVSVTVSSVTTTFAPRTFVWSGAVATLTLANLQYVGQTGGAALVDAIDVVAKDAAGNTVAPGALTWTISPASGLTVENPPDADGESDVTCTTTGTYTVTAKSGTITSNAVTIICSPAVASTDTFTVAFSAANIAPGGSGKLLVTIKNAAGQPVPDNSYSGITALLSSGALGTFSATKNGVAEATFLAPFASGQVSAVATVGSPISASKTASVTIGAPATAAASALGVAPAGPFTTTTKVTTRGKYVTFRFDLGTAAAGKAVTILAATKTGTTWSGFTAVTTRTADANGVVIYYARQSTATWKSFRAQETTTNVTPARQARWT